MPRSNWKGNIAFGLVNIPIVLFSAEEPGSSISFKQIDKKTGAKIKYKRVDVETEKEVPWEQIGKAYQYDKDTLLPVGEGELQRVAGENARTIAIENFIDKKNIHFIDVIKTYYLVPDKKGEKGYVILREALNKAGKVGIAKVIISTKEYLAALSTFENALVIYLLHYADEIRPLSEFDIPSDNIKTYKVTTKEIDIAKKLVDAMSIKWQPDKYHDEFKQALEKWVEQKIKKLPETHMPARVTHKTKGGAVNFMDLLKQSLATPSGNAKKKTKVKAKSKSKVPVHAHKKYQASHRGATRH